jgi:hypothetical protein
MGVGGGATVCRGSTQILQAVGRLVLQKSHKCDKAQKPALHSGQNNDFFRDFRPHDEQST